MLADTEVIAFLHQTPQELVLDTDPCLTPVFAPTEDIADELRRLAQ